MPACAVKIPGGSIYCELDESHYPTSPHSFTYTGPVADLLTAQTLITPAGIVRWSLPPDPAPVF